MTPRRPRGGFAVLALALAATLLLAQPAVGTPAPDVAAPREMTSERAGRYYVATICPTNRATARYASRGWGERESLSRGEVRERLPVLRRLAARVGEAHLRESDALFYPPRAWPVAVQPEIDSLLLRSQRQGSRWHTASEATTAAAWIRSQDAAAAIRRGPLNRRIHRLLELPTPPRGCARMVRVPQAGR